MKKLFIGLLTVVILGAMFMAPANTYEAEAYPDMDAEEVEEAVDALEELLQQKDVFALVYLTDEYQVREKADADSETVVTVASGQTVYIRGAEVVSGRELWIKVELLKEDQEFTGYIERSYLACSDEEFLQWEEEYGINDDFGIAVLRTQEGENVTYADIEAFPESYKEALTALKEAHPNWVFVKMETGLEWDTVVEEELYGGRSLISSGVSACLQEGKYSSGWSYPTREALEYYLDPRNGLTEDGIFQFEQLTYNASYHEDCESAVQSFLDNTFMSGQVPQWTPSTGNGTYAYAFWIIGKDLNISPFHLASRVYQEQGKGTSPLISGTYPGYEGYYNYFNIGASGSTDKAVIESGLSYAKNATPAWDCPYYSLYYGAKILGSNYINKGQDTLYLQKFDVDNSSSGMYWHQYMQNISAPTSEAKTIRNLYEEVGAIDNVFVFKIPVYNNMPQECPYPTQSDRVILSVEEGYTDATIWLDGVAYTAESRNGYYIVQASDMEAKIATMYQYNDDGIPTGMKVWKLDSDGSYYKVTELTDLEDLFVYQGFSIRITGKSGIRYKASIDSTLKSTLIQQGINGYKLTEYGNLVMTNEHRASYPMIKGGDKLTYGMAYGVDENGEQVDYVFDTADGRQSFTAVLVGLPAEKYKTEYAYRNYAVFTNGSEEWIVYGPIVYRSIYQVAEYYLSAGIYEDGSSEQLFLKQIISDAK